MKLQIYSVYDKGCGAFLQPFFARALGEAIRSFMDACMKDGLPFNAHPDHYTLYHHGEFDDGSGVFDSLADPERVISALECVAQSVKSV